MGGMKIAAFEICLFSLMGLPKDGGNKTTIDPSRTRR
jgi:hypothetical protein